jgi:hypothetical protein
MNVLRAALAALALVGLPMRAPAQSTEGPITIQGSILNEATWRRSGYEGTTTTQIAFYLTLSRDRISGSYTRNALDRTGRVLRSDHDQLSGPLGKVGEFKSDPGYAVATLSGNTLTVLRTVQTGATRFTIRMGRGSACSARMEQVQEVGKGNMERKGVGGDGVEIVAWRQVSHSCRMSRE